MMSSPSKGNRLSASRGLLANYKYLCKKTMLIRGMESARARKKRHDTRMISNRKKERASFRPEPLDPHKPAKKAKLAEPNLERQSTLTSASEPDHHSVITALRDSWEIDSGFSESSPPASGRSSPCIGTRPTPVVALDCEMVGTGPGGRCSELARCSIIDYQGGVLYDKYVRPCQPVTDFRTPWSGIRSHHLRDAIPFAQAREEVRLLHPSNSSVMEIFSCNFHK